MASLIITQNTTIVPLSVGMQMVVDRWSICYSHFQNSLWISAIWSAVCCFFGFFFANICGNVLFTKLLQATSSITPQQPIDHSYSS